MESECFAMSFFSRGNKEKGSSEALEREKRALDLERRELETRRKELEFREKEIERREEAAAHQKREGGSGSQGVSGGADKDAQRGEQRSRKRYDLSWLRYEDIIRCVRPYINVVENEKRFCAFSMPSGTVYIQAHLLDQIIRRLADEAEQEEIANLEEKADMRRVLIATTNFLKARKVIDEKELPGNNFGRNYLLTWVNGVSDRFFYIPLQASVFGDLGELEDLKPPKLQDIESVEPAEEIRQYGKPPVQ